MKSNQTCRHGWTQCTICHDKDGNLWPEKEFKKDYVPNAKKHLYTSLIKSAIRILGYFWLTFAMPSNFMLLVAVLVLVLSEFIGIYEELV